MKKILSILVCAAMLATLAAGCSNSESEKNSTSGSYTYADTIVWDAEYDVVVAGFGAAGAVTAKTASDNGAEVLIVEKMSEGEAGGNSKYAGQFFVYGNKDYEKTLEYFKNMAGSKTVPDVMLETLAKDVANLVDIWEEDFGLNPEDFMDWSGGIPVIGHMVPEYPELGGSETITMMTLHQGLSDSFMYQTLKQQVVDRSDKIDVWFESPAVHLIQDPVTKTIIGVQVEREGKTMNVRAKNGVVLCTGGYEDNAEMVETYLGLTNYAVIGGLHNTGDGIRMAQEVGADLWHMHVYEGALGLGGVSFNVGEGEHAQQIETLTKGPLNTGALILVGTDGDRIVNESEIYRHGHIYYNGVWENPRFTDRMWVVYDQTQADLIAEKGSIPEEFRAGVVSANTIEELAALTQTKPDQLKAAIEQFNNYAATGVDEQFKREAEYMRAFDGNKYYAFEVKAAILNTQGGPKRNENAEVLDVNGNPIPHLYSAGELGGITSQMYQGGTNLAECVIFGRIAGKNAAAAKEDLPAYTPAPQVESTPTHLGEVSDLNKTVEVETAENEFVGTAQGIGGTLTVKVTMDGDTIVNVEVVSHSETEGICEPAIEQIPAAIVANNGVDGVDTVSGASVTSKAIMNAVTDALSKK